MQSSNRIARVSRSALAAALLLVFVLSADAAKAQCARCPNASFGGAVRAIGPDLAPAGSAVVADFDGDGIPDIAARVNEAVAVFLGRGAANFGSAVRTPVPSIDLNVRVVAGDFNEDGKQDLAVAILGQGVAILLGGGNGRFMVQQAHAAGVELLAIAVGDIDGDGHLDVVTLATDGFVRLLRGDGHGGLAGAQSFPTGLSFGSPGFLAVGDLNGDGRLDVAVGGGSPGLVVLMGSAAGFGPPISLEAFQSHAAVLIADATGDGKPDVIASATFPGDVAIFPGDGAGNFGAAIFLTMGSAPNQLAVADLNGDGKPDLAAIISQGNQIVTRVGDGAGGFGPARIVYVGAGPGSLAVADLDGDGVPDFVTGNSNGVSVALGDGSGGTSASAVRLADFPGSFVVADFDGDGKADVATAYSNPGTVSILRGLGNGSFAPEVPYATADFPGGLVAADVNGDGKPDLVFLSSAGLSTLLNNGTGHFVAGTSRAVGCFNLFGPPIVADLDGDGRPDVAVACDSSIHVFFGDGAGGFSAPLEIVTEARWLAVGDVDGDGHLDLVSAGPFSTQVHVAFGDGHGSFAAPIGADLPHVQAYGLVLADFDGDGRLDIATGVFVNGNFVDVAFGDGSGGFGRPRSIPVAVSSRPMIAVDLDGDGRLDLVAAQGEELDILMNDGAGSFAASQAFAGGSFFTVAAGDLNGDGLPDLVFGGVGTNFMALLNTNCKPRRLSFLPSSTLCSREGIPIAPSPLVRVVDDGDNTVSCATGAVTATLAGGVPGAVLLGTTSVPVAAGVAAFDDLRIDLPGLYRLGFTHSGPARSTVGTIHVGSGVSVTVSGPAQLCGSDPAVYDAGPGFSSYVWTLDGDPVSFGQRFAAPFLASGSHALSVRASLGGCDGTASMSISNAPPSATSIIPSSGSQGGFTPVRVTGGCIAAAATLSLGGVPARSVSAPDSTALVGMTPRHVPATVDAVLTNPDGQIATLPSSYTYLAGNGAYPLTPCRVLDTRGPIGLTGGPALPSRTWRAFPISGSCGVPQGAVAIMVNAAVTSPTAPGTINIGGSDILAFSAGQTRSNNGFVMLDEFGSVYFLNTSSGTADVILDVTGYFR